MYAVGSKPRMEFWFEFASTYSYIAAGRIEGSAGDAGVGLAEAESPTWKPRLREQTERAERLGIFGAPSFVVGSELFWGSELLTPTCVLWREWYVVR